MGTDDPAGSKGLLKWKGVMFAPDDGVDQVEHGREETEKDVTDSIAPVEDLEQGSKVCLSIFFVIELYSEEREYFILLFDIYFIVRCIFFLHF